MKGLLITGGLAAIILGSLFILILIKNTWVNSRANRQIKEQQIDTARAQADAARANAEAASQRAINEQLRS